MQTHNWEQAFTCKNVGEEFSITVNPKRHVETPIVHKPNSCKKCGARFSLSQSVYQIYQIRL